VAEHEALVAGAALVHAHRDVARLVVDGGDHRAGVAVEAVLGAVVADVANDLPHQARDLDVALARDLAGHEGRAGGDQHLAGHAAHGILPDERVEHAVGDLVGDLVGVALGHRFGGEQVGARGLARGARLGGRPRLCLGLRSHGAHRNRTSEESPTLRLWNTPCATAFSPTRDSCRRMSSTRALGLMIELRTTQFLTTVPVAIETCGPITLFTISAPGSMATGGSTTEPGTVGAPP